MIFAHTYIYIYILHAYVLKKIHFYSATYYTYVHYLYVRNHTCTSLYRLDIHNYVHHLCISATTHTYVHCLCVSTATYTYATGAAAGGHPEQGPADPQGPAHQGSGELH